MIFGFGSLSIESPASLVFFLGLVLISFWQGGGGGPPGAHPIQGARVNQIQGARVNQICSFFLFGGPL